MKKVACLLIYFFVVSLFSQEENLQKQFKAEFNFLGIGASYELPISENWLLDIGAGVGGGVEDGDGYVWELNSSLSFYSKGELRYYINRKKRAKKNKNNINNSGNYFGLQTKYFSKRFTENSGLDPLTNSLLTELHWGLQRSLGDNWLFNFHVGLGALRKLDEDRGLMSPAIGLKFSYKLF
ncbi:MULTISPECIES: hypothetical protein [unclassified Polaribacter]|uniref:hypothetical protein n=1 Tax=unclassified Polaribacter TaxID=196858 RepID=UPI0011BED845|nr:MULTISPECIES: hypothetical protein [unclassified Polaribacter]TXD52423.1 hypothetical protein ES043_08495 [Polaribacter sp. IC063]TXD61060.1 hypothetical protein ES044_05765 [Polaribacter sp. IC066]